MEKSKVYFTDFRAKLGEGLPLKLKRLLKKGRNLRKLIWRISL